jgi:hypothetical protein
MNSPDKWVRGCLGKKRYSNYDFVEKLIKKLKKERGAELRAYSCRECCGFHLTKQMEPVKMVL